MIASAEPPEAGPKVGDSRCQGTGKSGQTDGARPEFYEPGGISIARGRLYVADTNNHAVRVLALDRREVTTLRIEG